MKNRRLFQLLAGFMLFLISFQLVSCGGDNNDANIQTQITSLTQTTPELETISASVSKGVVTLVGQCRSEKDRERAEKAIKNIDDVKNVINNVTVTDNIVVTPDNQLRDGATNALKKYKHVQSSVSNGVITVRGSLDKDDLSQLIMDLNALKPKRIDNQLVVE
jgi:osmotically-inducible protein OsmY